ncbi:MAG: hypothetical protein ACRDG4_13785, partial [Chloroflexota bacterium]
VLDGLDAALAARLLEERWAGRGERYGFAHALIAQVLYDEAPRHRLRRLHLRAGEALARARGERPEEAAEVARHFLAGGAEARALPYLERAGDHAMTLYAHEEALGHYQTAVDLLGEGGDEGGLAAARRRLAGALVRLNRTAEAVALYEQALAYYTRGEERAEQASVEYEIGLAHRAAYANMVALHHLETALRLWPENHQPARAARLYLDVALGRLSADGQEAAAAAADLADRGLALAERYGDPALRAYGLGIRANIESVGDWRATYALYESAVQLARQSGDRETLLRILGSQGFARRMQGELRAALHDFRERLALAVELGLVTQIIVGQEQIALTCADLGEWAEAREALSAALALDPTEPYRMLFDAWFHGDQARAIALAEREVDTARERHDLILEFEMLTTVGYLRSQM